MKCVTHLIDNTWTFFPLLLVMKKKNISIVNIVLSWILLQSHSRFLSCWIDRQSDNWIVCQWNYHTRVWLNRKKMSNLVKPNVVVQMSSFSVLSLFFSNSLHFHPLLLLMACVVSFFFRSDASLQDKRDLFPKNLDELIHEQLSTWSDGKYWMTEMLKFYYKSMMNLPSCSASVRDYTLWLVSCLIWCLLFPH